LGAGTAMLRFQNAESGSSGPEKLVPWLLVIGTLPSASASVGRVVKVTLVTKVM